MRNKRTSLYIILSIFLTINSYSQCACCAGASIGSSNGDFNNGLLTLKKNQFIAETYFDYRKIKEGTAIEEDEKLLKSMIINSFGVRYVITNKFTVSALLPFVTLSTNTGNDKGFGDMILIGTYSIFSKKNLNIALQAGIELPTGIQKDSNFDNSTVVIGSGSYDPMVGVVFSNNWNNYTLQGNALYKHTNKGFDGNYYSSLAVQNITLSHRLIKESAFCSANSDEKANGSNLGLSLFGGYNGEWLDNLKEGDEIDENSGYYLGFVNVGSNISYKNFSLPITFSIPIINNMNGNQNDASFRVKLGIIITF